MSDYETRENSDVHFQSILLDEPQLKQKDSQVEKKVVPITAADTVAPSQYADPIIFTSVSPIQYPRMCAYVEPYLPTMFGRVPEKFVTFCIDTSGSMFYALDVVKEHLIEALSSLAAQDDKPMFNLIEFNSQVTKWADKMIHCTSETVAAAKQWVLNLTAKTGTNTQDALLTALDDPSCQAIYLVTDDIPDQCAEEVLDKIIGICGRCHIHCIYISGDNVNEAAVEFLEDLALETYGSIHIVTLTTHGCVERVTPVYRADHSRRKLVQTLKNTLQPNLKTCSVSTALQFNPDKVLGLYHKSSSLSYQPSALLSDMPYPFYPHYWSRFCPAKTWRTMQARLGDSIFDFSPAAGCLLIGKKVIARRIQDGYFYRATIKSQNSHDSFLVAFAPCRRSNFCQTEYEDVFVSDIVDCTDALHRTIITGDRVLAVWETKGDRFAPGIVVTGQEQKQADSLINYSLTVSFGNGKVQKVLRDNAVWIPSALYERLTQKFQMPATSGKTRSSLVENCLLENANGHPTVDYQPCSTRYPWVDPLAIDANSYYRDSVLHQYHFSFPGYNTYTQSVVRQREEKSQRDREEITLQRKAGNDGSALDINAKTKQNLNEQAEVQEHQPRNRMNSQEMVTNKVSNIEEDRVSSKFVTLLTRREKQEENNLSRWVQSATEERTRKPNTVDSRPFKIHTYGLACNRTTASSKYDT